MMPTPRNHVLLAILVATAAAGAGCQQQADNRPAQPPAQQTPAQPVSTPGLKPQPTPQAVVDEHLDALNKGDWDRLMAQYPADVEIFLPAGALLRGRDQVGDAFRGLVKPFKDGGLLGVVFTSEHVFTVGDTVNVQWRVDADFLKEPYRGADAYVTRDGLMAAQVTTFDMAELRALAR